MLAEKCALMHTIFRNDKGVRLLEHVRLLERIQYVFHVTSVMIIYVLDYLQNKF